jgi:hypothetical protein
LPADQTASLGVSISSSAGVVSDTGILLCERSNAKLTSAAKVVHDDEEWSHLYRTCLDDGHEHDITSLMRLICAQTRAINAGSSSIIYGSVTTSTYIINNSDFNFLWCCVYWRNWQ